MRAAHKSVFALRQAMAGYSHFHHPPQFVRGGIVVSVSHLGRLTALATVVGRQVIVAEDGIVLGNLRPVIAATIAEKVVAAAVGDVNALVQV